MPRSLTFFISLSLFISHFFIGVTYGDHKNSNEDTYINSGYFFGGIGQWHAFLEPRGKKETSYCVLSILTKTEKINLAKISFNDENSFNIELKEDKNPMFSSSDFPAMKKLVKEVCINNNIDHVIENFSPSLVSCSQYSPKTKIVMWDTPNSGVELQRGFLTVEGKIIDGLIFYRGNGYEPYWWGSESGFGGKRIYFETVAAKPGSQRVIDLIVFYLHEFGGELWYANNYTPIEKLNTKQEKLPIQEVGAFWSKEYCED